MDCVYDTYAEKDLSQLQRVTLVIPTHNRNYYLSRCLWYHAHFPFAEIIVADSSDENKQRINRQTVEEIQQLFDTKVTYLEYNFPPDEYGGEIYRKWGNAVMRVETEYSLSCTDKEFLIPTTVAKSVTFLDKHPDYSIADGRYYMAKSTKLIVPWQGGDGKLLASSNTLSRLQGLLESNTAVGTQFAVQHSINHKSIFNNMNTYNLYDIRFGETEIELLPILFGKMWRDWDSIMSIRDVTQNKKRHGLIITTKKSESSFTRYPLLLDYPPERYEKYLRRLIECLEYNTQSGADNVSEVVENVFKQRYKREIQNRLLSKSNLLWNIWDNRLPYKWKYILSKNLGAGVVQPSLKKKEFTKEIRTILHIMKEVSNYYDTDDTVHNHLNNDS